MKQAVRKTMAITLIAALQLSSAVQAADLSGQMQQMFNQAGVMGNTTGPGSYRGQTMSIYTGGEMQMRAPIRNYQIWSVSLPTPPKAGCGGIDLYTGSISHIDGPQFKALLQQIGANTVGLLFKAALKSINPMIESVLGDLEKTIAEYNKYSINSCKAAESLVNGLLGSSRASSNANCITNAMQQYNESYPEAEDRCRGDAATVNKDVRDSGNQAVAALAQRDINLVWDALKDSTYTKEEKELFMNVAGTMLLFKAENNGGAARMSEFRDPSVDSLRVLMFGNQPGGSIDTVQIVGWWSCPDADCMNPTPGTTTITPFPTLVRKRLEDLRDKIETKQKLTPELVGFINQTSVPVYRMLSVGYQSNSAGRGSYLSDVLIARYAKVIAYDYAHAFLSRALKDVRVYIGLAKLQTTAEETQAAEMRRRVDAMIEQLDRERAEAQSRVRDADAVVADIQRIEREMRTGLPNAIRNMLDFSNLLTGRRM